MNSMKINVLAAGVLLSLAGLANAATTAIVNGGNVHFTGEVVNAACAVDANSTDQTVKMGQVKTSTLAKAGNSGDKVPFTIQLDDCDTSVSTKASISFSGTTAGGTYTNALALAGSSAGSATNVGIQILDSTGSPIALDGVAFSKAIDLNDGKTVLPFSARYIATADAATAGIANADATFKVQYQ